MTDPKAHAARSRQASLEAFLSEKDEFDALLAELQQASEDQFDTDPEAVLWSEGDWLADVTAKLRDIADQCLKRGEYAV